MVLTGKAEFICRRDGVKKDGTPWYYIKLLDSDADEFITAFVDERIYKEFEKVARRTGVVLTLNLVPGKKYFSVEGYELDV